MVPTKDLRTIILAGPTAVGKSSLAIELAEKLRGRIAVEIINADSVCFYREFNIGSAKPTPQEILRVPHHLIDVADPTENYHAGRFIQDCNQKIQEIHGRGAAAIIVGGSGFYLKSLRLGLWEAPPTSPEFRTQVATQETSALFEKLVEKDPAHAQRIGPNDRYRIIRALEIILISGKIPSTLEAEMDKEPDPRFLLWSLDRDREELSGRIRARIKSMIESGWIDEVISLRDRYPTSKTLHAVGYQQVLDFLDGVEPEGRKIPPGIPGLIEEIGLAHRQLAKQQRTWIKSLKPERIFDLSTESAQLDPVKQLLSEFTKEILMNFDQ